MTKLIDFSNGYSMKMFSRDLGFVFAICLVGFIGWYLLRDTESIVLTVLTSLAVFVMTILSKSRNSYVVQDGFLGIKEYNLIWKTLDVQVRIENIRRAEVVWSWYWFERLVRLYMKDGSTIDLYCITHANHLTAYLNNKTKTV